jgi:hypothetical protein
MVNQTKKTFLSLKKEPITQRKRTLSSDSVEANEGDMTPENSKKFRDIEKSPTHQRRINMSENIKNSLRLLHEKINERSPDETKPSIKQLQRRIR